DFWATWCPPCRREIPGFISLQKKYEKDGLMVVGVSLDQGGTDAVKRFIQKNGMNYPVVMGNDRVSADYGNIQAIPTTFVIDRSGKIVSKHVGYEEPSVFEQEIKPLLASK
ncbi:MAG: TlpA family protein disulfide reductase, partial [Candidatus Omnitrophica bacterium]|nr:TlpA family protein disulfide reductase [Candidatus Omnitrophota bacterium]